MRFLIAGAFSKQIPIMRFLKNYNGDSQIVLYDGINKCDWNGGRINRDVYYNIALMEYYYDRGVRLALTMSNHNVDLSDPVGNHLLDVFHRPGNCLIIVNDELRKYVRENYPQYELIHSITGMGHLNIPLQDEDIEWYKQKEKDYDWIVPRFEHVFDPRSDELDKTKWEVMVNDTCVYKCKYFDEHFKAIADANTRRESYNPDIEECWLPKFNPDKESKYNCMDIDSEYIRKLKDVGVHSFKITGREMTDEMFEHDLLLYANRIEEA